MSSNLNSSFCNPVIAGDYPDPSIVRVGKDYYMTHSPFHYAPGFLIWRSQDLVNWTPVARALMQYHGDIWAPDLVHHKEMFYIYYRCNYGNHVITAPQIEGPWSKPVNLNIGEIDPGHIADLEGKRYLHMSGGKAVSLADDGLSVTGELKKVYDGWPIPANWRIENFCLEGPKLIFKDGYYHLFSAEGGTAGPSTSHMVVHARSRSPLGPWENSHLNPVIHTESRSEKWWSRGHGTVFEAAAGDWWMVYHAYDRDAKTLGRQTLMQAVEWTKDGWLKVSGGSNPSEPIRAPKLAPVLLPPLERSDDFSGPELGLQWQFWDEYDPSRFKFQDNSIVINGKGKSPADCNPVSCLAGDMAYEVTVDVEIEGSVQAGLLLFYNPSFYAGMGISEGAIWGGARGCLNKLRTPLAGRRMTLRIVCDHNEVDFLAGTDAGSLKKVSNSEDLSGYNHNTLGGFLALRPALYSAGSGKALFRNFRYRPL